MRYRDIKPDHIGGFYPNAKVYFDGSHYVAIPHTEQPFRRRKKPIEEVVEVADEAAAKPVESDVEASESDSGNDAAEPDIGIKPVDTESDDGSVNMTENKPKKTVTKKQLFEDLYKENLYAKRKERRGKIIEGMLPYFKSEGGAVVFVDRNLERKKRNLIARRIRFTRKANLQEFNFFVTITYDGAIHTEESFRKKLKNTLGHLCSRKGWKYMGVWERSPEKQRLHFHGIFYIPKGTMPGILEAVQSYSICNHRMQTTMQNSYFLREFGRNDFEEISSLQDVYTSMAYIMKYIEKSGEKIVYSRGLPQFFISDIMDDDIVCTMGEDDKKLVLFDNFTCWDEGVLVGTVSKETIAQLKKVN